MKLKKEKFAELELLTSKVLDDDYTTIELRRLSSLLRESKEARARYSQLALQESILHWESVDCDTILNTKSEKSKMLFFPIISSFAAAIVALIGVWWLHSEKKHAQLLVPKQMVNAEPNKANTFPVSDDLDNFILSHPKKEILSASLSIPDDSIFSRSNAAKSDALHGIDVLKSSQNYGEGGIVLNSEQYSSWNRSEHISVPMENGVSPQEGGQMMKFSSLNVDVDTQTAEVSEMVQILDVRKLQPSENGKGPQIQTSLFFNQGDGISSDPTQFSLSFHAIASNEKAENSSIGHKSVSIESDINPTTWEELKEDFTLPNGTEFVIVSMSAKKDGPGALLPNNSGHYADGLKINLLVDGQNVVGPL